MPTIPVGSLQSYAVAGVGTDYKGFTVQNSGTTRLYFAHDPGVNPQNYGNFVDPGGSIAWPEGSPCYVIAATSGGQINYSPLVAALSGSASGTVSLSPGSSVGLNPGASVEISNASIPVTGSLDANITNASIPVSGTVDIASGTIDVGTIGSITAGDVTVNGSVSLLHSQDVLFNSASVALPVGTTTIFDTAGAVDLSKYSTIYVSLIQPGALGVLVVATATETFYDHSTGLGIANNYSWFTSGGISWYTNVIGSSYKLVINNPSNATNVKVLIIGMTSNEAPRATLFPLTGPPQGGAVNMGWTAIQLPGFYGFDASVTAGGTVAQIFPIFTTGPNHLSQEMPSASYAGWALQYFTSPVVNAGRIQQFGSSGPYTSTPNIPVTLRAYPVVFQTNSIPAAGERFISTLTSDLGPVNAL